MSHVSDIRLQASNRVQENRSWAGEPASGFNMYAYTNGDPLNATDPSGLNWVNDVGTYGAGYNNNMGGGACGCEGNPEHETMQNYMNQQIAYNQSPTGLLPQPVLAKNLPPPATSLVPPISPATLGDVIGKVINLPNDAIGLLAGAVEAVSGVISGNSVHIGFGDDALQISGGGIGAGAITFGNVQLYNGSFGSTPVTPSYVYSPRSYTYGDVRIGAHESGHSAQSEVLGPAFLPAYAVSGLLSGGCIVCERNPFERSADYYGRGTGGPFSGF